MNKKKKFFNIIIYFLAFILVFGFVIYAGRFNAFGKFISGIENKTFDIRQNFMLPHKKNNNDIVIIAVDDPSYEYITENFGTWPVPRSFWAKLIKGLEKANPKFIAFDLLFTKRLDTPDKGDLELIEAVKNNKNVYLSMNFDNYPPQIRKPPILPQRLGFDIKNGDVIKNSPYLHFSNCRNAMDELLKVTSNFGFINVTRDEDGIIRYIAPIFYYNGAYYPNLTTLIALKYLNIQPESIYVDKNNNLVLDNKHKIPLNPDGRAIFNWYGKEGTYEHISLWEVDDAINRGDTEYLKQKFENKIIYIGTTVTALADIKSTPVSFMYPGVETHATFLNNILDNNFIKHLSFKADLIISVLICFLIGYCVLKFESVPYSLLCVIQLIIIYLIITVLAMTFFNLWLGIVLPVYSATLILIVSYIAKYLFKSRDYEHTYKLAVTDGLTELYNHRYFQEQMIMNVGSVARYGGSFSLILIDIDFFKKFNDTHGHQSGDAVLRQVAQTIKKNIRTSDIPCRYGGEEMSIILTNTKKEDAITTAKKVWSAIRERKFELADGSWANVTISVGVASMPDNGKTPQELIEFADKCLYKAKQNGRDRVESEI